MEEKLKEIVEQMEILFEFMTSDKLAEKIAQMYWKIFSRLTKEGFTEEQAIQILSRMNLGATIKE